MKRKHEDDEEVEGPVPTESATKKRKKHTTEKEQEATQKKEEQKKEENKESKGKEKLEEGNVETKADATTVERFAGIETNTKTVRFDLPDEHKEDDKELEEGLEPEEDDPMEEVKPVYQGKFVQKFSEDSEFGSTKYKGEVEGEEEDITKESLALEEGYELKGIGQVEVEAFNMNEERDLGQIDSHGHFIGSRRNWDDEELDPNKQADAWLNDINEFATTKKIKETMETEEEEEEEAIDLLEAKRKVCECLYHTETVGDALRRLGKALRPKKRVPAWRKRRKSDADTSDTAKKPEDTKTTQELEELQKKFDFLTEITSRLLNDELLDIFSLNKDGINDLIEKEEKKRIKKGEQWQYKSGGETYGPFSLEDMVAWYKQGYLDDCLAKRVKDSSFVKITESDLMKHIDFLEEPTEATTETTETTTTATTEEEPTNTDS
eukprot:CAMPEP_0174268414 /NCGR_PEP_ID=MMETSP0439-20130205/37321_1 /TAXON_ID=0 /ORGANISM="Stereomyxa ramosa, Strain Chinc5" /LENGTH=435 /DNA_ID=CAMNT_0015356563 /DNA_START=39 /DNA_END=1346 /DNA_ORIENTATION=-